MTVIEYLNTDIAFELSAQEAFNLYDTAYPSVAKFPYFRTHFNNKKRELGISTAVKIVPVLQEIHENKIKREKPVFTAINYTGQDVSGLIPETIPTGTKFDQVISDNGFCRKCVDAVAAKAGSGKTWSRMSLMAKAVILNPNIKAALLSAEMLSHEIAREVKSSPELNNIDFVYLVDYFKQQITPQDYWDILEECFKRYDILTIDSFSVVHDQLLELYDGKIKSKKLIFDITSKLTKWAAQYNCNVQLILQCKRDGTYLGSSALVHAISSLAYVYVYGQKRFNLYEKNRNNGSSVNRELFFSKDKEGGIVIDEEAYKASYERVEDTKVDIKTFLQNLKEKHEQGTEENKELVEAEKPKIDPKDLVLSREQVIDNQMDIEDLIAMEELQNEQDN
jgi:predicted ATP-dependent serine protease